MAPMEGITGYIYRTTFHKYFSGVDKYFMPFISPAKGRPLRTRERKDILPENNENMNVIPQILTNDGEAFKKIAVSLKEYGYEEVNINLGCPSGTVVSKCKGSGLLYDLDRLEHFLYQVFEADVMKVSIKTRVGKLFPEEFEDILNVYRKYPITELIIHPRVQTDYYNGSPRMDTFDQAVRLYDVETAVVAKGETAQNTTEFNTDLCYNGDIFTAQEYHNFHEKYPDIDKVMLGRGLIGNPFLAEEIKGISHGCDMTRFKEFHDELLFRYTTSDLGDKNTLFKMKELWHYMGRLFDEGENGKQLKKIKKSKTIGEYEVAVGSLIHFYE
jgi:tRNA-dihydrouridine synthase